MSVIYLLIAFCTALLAGYSLTKILIYYSIKHSLVDNANSRSSHTLPTPRIGGISFVVVITLVLIGCYLFNFFILDTKVYFSLIIPPLIICAVSLIDDLTGGTSRLVRLMCHLISVVIVICFLQLPKTTLLQIAIVLTLSIAGTWLINLYNFMDGIDGIAASEALFVLLASAGFCIFKGHGDWGFIQLVMTAPILGFLLLNWKPAKTFMGDIGSTYLGILLFTVLLVDVMFEILPVLSCVILLGTFLVDATWTLFYRLTTGQKWYDAHRSHSYQILARKFESHSRVSLGNIAINVFWLLPLSIIAALYPSYGLITLLVAFSPLIVICLVTGAGKNKLCDFNI